MSHVQGGAPLLLPFLIGPAEFKGLIYLNPPGSAWIEVDCGGAAILSEARSASASPWTGCGKNSPSIRHD